MAGLTTSLTRARVYQTAMGAWDSQRKAPACIAIATDAIIVTGSDPPPPSVRLGRTLGEWKEERFEGCQVAGSGLYRLLSTDLKKEPVERARGVRQRRLPWDRVAEAWRTGAEVVSFPVVSFIGHKRSKKSRLFTWRTWDRVTRDVKVRNAGTKREPLTDGPPPDPAHEIVWTQPTTLPILNQETAPNLPSFAEVVPARPRPEDTCEDDGQFALDE